MALSELLLNFAKEHSMSDADEAYWQELVTQSIKCADTLSEKMQPFLTRPVKSINPVELAILRVSFYELSERLDIPYRVIINEAIELTKVFGAVDSHRFINGALDAAAKELRGTEVAMKRRS